MAEKTGSGVCIGSPRGHHHDQRNVNIKKWKLFDGGLSVAYRTEKRDILVILIFSVLV